MSRLPQLEKLHAADPRDADVMYMMAQEYMKVGDARLATSWYDKCLAADADYHYAYYHKARALELLGETPNAIETLRAGIDRADAARNGKALSELSSYLEALGG
jgi:tetratricopeptide (TPR) repeat protein